MSLFICVEALKKLGFNWNTAIIDLIAKFINLTTQKEEINFVALGLFELCLLSAGFALLFLVLLKCITVDSVKARLLMDEFIGCLIKLIYMIAEILRSS